MGEFYLPGRPVAPLRPPLVQCRLPLIAMRGRWARRRGRAAQHTLHWCRWNTPACRRGRGCAGSGSRGRI